MARTTPRPTAVRQADRPRASARARKGKAEAKTLTLPLATQERVAGNLPTTCKPCDDLMPHSMWRVSFSRFGQAEHQILRCNNCGHERRLEALRHADLPVGDKCMCGVRITESSHDEGSALCLRCEEINTAERMRQR
jgi:RNase P subunit RPR2